MANDVRQRALAYLQQHHVMTLATVGADGVWAAAVFYANEGVKLYFLSAGHTRHAQSMHLNSKVAATIQENYKDWTAIQGIQLAGTVHRLQGAAMADAIALYRRRHPFLVEGHPEIEQAFTKVNWYCLVPQQLFFIDNSKGLGHRDEIEMGR